MKPIYQFVIKLLPLTVLWLFYSKSAAQYYHDSLVLQYNHFSALPDSLQQAKIGYQLAKFHYNNYNDSAAEVYLKKSIQLFKAKSENRSYCTSLNLYGNLLSDIGNNKQAITIFHEALAVAKQIKHDTLLTMIYNNLALAQKDIGLYEPSLSNLFEALTLKEKLNLSPKSISSTLLNIGLVLDILNKPVEANHYYKKSLVIKQNLNDSLGMANIYSNLAVIQKNNNRFDSAQFYIEKSLLFAPGNLNLVYINQTTLGNMAYRQKNYKQALHHFKLAKHAAQMTNNSNHLSDVSQNMGNCLLALQQYNEAAIQLQNALLLTQTTRSVAQMHEIHQKLAQAYIGQKQYQHAYFHLNLSNTYRDSLYKIEQLKALEEIKVKYETEKNLRELSEKNLAITIEKAENRKKSSLIILLILSFGLIVIIAWFAFSAYKSKKHKQQYLLRQKLQEYNLQIEALRTQISENLNTKNKVKKINDAHVTVKPAESTLHVKMSISASQLNHYLLDPLTEREQDVLQQIALGNSNKQVAGNLYVSENTVKFHLKNIFLKLDVQNRTEALAKASALQILG